MPFHYNYNVQALLSQMHKGYYHITDQTLNERHISETEAVGSSL